MSCGVCSEGREEPGIQHLCKYLDHPCVYVHTIPFFSPILSPPLSSFYPSPPPALLCCPCPQQKTIKANCLNLFKSEPVYTLQQPLGGTSSECSATPHRHDNRGPIALGLFSLFPWQRMITDLILCDLFLISYN